MVKSFFAIPKLRKEDYMQAVIVGTAVAAGTIPVTGLLMSVLGMIPNTTVMDVIVPHGIIAAGGLALVANLLVKKYL